MCQYAKVSQRQQWVNIFYNYDARQENKEVVVDACLPWPPCWSMADINQMIFWKYIIRKFPQKVILYILMNDNTLMYCGCVHLIKWSNVNHLQLNISILDKGIPFLQYLIICLQEPRELVQTGVTNFLFACCDSLWQLSMFNVVPGNIKNISFQSPWN